METVVNDEKRPIPAQEFKNELENDSHWRQASSTVGIPGLTYRYDRNVFLTQVASIDGAVQKVAPTPSLTQQLYQSNYLTLAGRQVKNVSMTR